MKTLLIFTGLIVVTLSAPHHHRHYRHDVTSDNAATFTEMDSMVAEGMMDHATEDADSAVEGDDEEVTEKEEEDGGEVTNVEEEDEGEDATDNVEEVDVNDGKEGEDEAADGDMSSGDADAASDEEADDAEEDLFAAEEDAEVEAPESTDGTSQMEEAVTTSDNGCVGGDITVAVSKSEGDGAVTKTFTTSVKSKLTGSGTNSVSSVSAFLEGTFGDKIIDLTSVKNEVDQTVE